MAVRTDASADYVGRSASLPSPVAVTMCGWADMVVDRGNFSSLCCLTASPRTNGQLCLQTDATGNDVNLWYDSGSIAVTELATGYSAAVGVPFFWALTCEGTSSNQVKAYFRTRGSNTFNVAFTGSTGLGATFTPVLMRFGNADTSEFWNGRLWNIKVWDRALSSKELLAESFYQRVLYPSSLHLHYLLRGAVSPIDDTYDYSGNGRTATFNGALTTEPATGNHGLWVPRRQIVAARGATTQSFSYSAAGGLQLAGAASQIRVRVPAPAGGLQLGGAATVTTSGTQQFSYTAQGGLTLAGAAAQTRVAARAALGGLQLGGAASAASHEQQRVVTPSGGLVLGGAASVSTFDAGAKAGDMPIRRRRR